MSYDRLLQRVRAQRHPCPYCQQLAGAPCVNPATGEELEHQPDHLARIQLANKETSTQ